MTTGQRAKDIEHERKVIETCHGWKRDARTLYRVTPRAVALFDVSMDRVIQGCYRRIAKYRAEL